MSEQEKSLTVVEPEAPMAPLSVAEVLQRVRTVEQIVREVMVEDCHYGVQPGTQSKTLRQPGGEVLCLAFQMSPEMLDPEIDDLGDGHRNVVSTCVLKSLSTGQELCRAHGSCSTKEAKYRYRYAELLCPDCQHETIRKSRKDEDGWYCWRKIGGCGATFKDGDQRIEGQERGKIENPDLADVYNTVLKMADKRAFLAAVRMRTGASALFQYVEGEEEQEAETPTSQKQPDRQASQKTNKQQSHPEKAESPERLKQKTLFAELHKSPLSEADLRSHLSDAYDISSTKDLTDQQYTEVMDWIKEITKMQAEATAA